MGVNKRGSISTEVAMACVAFLILGLTLLLFITKNNNPAFTFSFAALEHSKNFRNFTGAPSPGDALRVVVVDGQDEVKSIGSDGGGAVGKFLIPALREATARAAASGRDYDEVGLDERIAAASKITDEEVEAWRRKHPCRSRGEFEPQYMRRKFVKYLKPNPLWQRVFAEYEKLHRTCMKKVLGGDGDITHFVFSGDFRSLNTSGCKFVVADAQDFGLGNRLYAVSSTFVYALLTQRVILVPDQVIVPDIVCEPFVGSSWRISGDSVRNEELWTSSDRVWAAMNGTANITDEALSMYAVRLNTKQWRPDDRFWCDAEQDYLTRATWLYFKDCFYTVPKMFAVPRFRPVLEELFPDRRVLTHVLHSLMLPADVVWNRVKQVDNAFIKHADRRVGVQIRYRAGPFQFNKDHEMVNTRVLQCGIENGFLPQPYDSTPATTASTTGSMNAAAPETIIVLTTSLFRSAHDFLTQTYVRHPPRDEKTAAVGVVQLTYEGGQASGLEEDIQALTEMILLSFSDHLLVTPLSTFGSIAQSYGALQARFVDVRPDSNEACEAAKSTEVCWQQATQLIDCPSEPRENKKLIWDVMPYVSNCSTLEGEYEGVQLLTLDFS